MDIKATIRDSVTFNKNKNIFVYNNKKILKKDIVDIIAKDLIKDVDISYKTLLEEVSVVVGEIERAAESELTSLDRRAYEESVRRELAKIIATRHTDIPLRIHRPADTKEIVLLIVKDVAHRVVTPIIAGSDKATRGEYLKASKIMCDVIYGILDEMQELGLQATIDDVVEQILHHVLSSREAEDFVVETLSTLSTDPSVWSTSYLDIAQIDHGDPTRLGPWESFRAAIDDDEGWELFCAWVWGIFDAQCVDKNRQALWLWGQGYDGKSAVSRVIQYIISGIYGSTYGSAAMMSDQLEAQFWASAIYGKSLAVLCEVTDPNFFGGRIKGKLHTWLGGDPAPIEDKGKGVFASVLHARCLIHANVQPTYDAGHINALTRIIPVQIKRSHFKGLDYTGTDFAKSTWEEDLFASRFDFLAWCRICYKRRYTDQHLFWVSAEYQETHYERSDKSYELDDLSTYISAGDDVYRPCDVKSYLVYIAKSYFKRDYLSTRDVGYIYDKVGVKRTSQGKGSSKVLKCAIPDTYIDDYNNNIDVYYKGNDLLKIKKIVDSNKDMQFDNFLESNEKKVFNLPENFFKDVE